jgi:hypothetical protein
MMSVKRLLTEENESSERKSLLEEFLENKKEKDKGMKK